MYFISKMQKTISKAGVKRGNKMLKTKKKIRNSCGFVCASLVFSIALVAVSLAIFFVLHYFGTYTDITGAVYMGYWFYNTTAPVLTLIAGIAVYFTYKKQCEQVELLQYQLQQEHLLMNKRDCYNILSRMNDAANRFHCDYYTLPDGLQNFKSLMDSFERLFCDSRDERMKQNKTANFTLPELLELFKVFLNEGPHSSLRKYLHCVKTCFASITNIDNDTLKKEMLDALYGTLDIREVNVIILFALLSNDRALLKYCQDVELFEKYPEVLPIFNKYSGKNYEEIIANLKKINP